MTSACCPARCAVLCQKPKDEPLLQRENEVQVGLVILLGGEEICAFTGSSVQDVSLGTRFVFKDHNNILSCVAVADRLGLFKRKKENQKKLQQTGGASRRR